MSFARWPALVLALGVASCGPSGPELHPVTGTVLLDGQPADGATVVFHPVGGGPDAPRPGAVAGKDGAFALNTHPHGAGAPAGEYTVLVTWLVDGPGGGDGKNKVPARYADPTQSGLRATVKPGPNQLEPFQLSKKAR